MSSEKEWEIWASVKMTISAPTESEATEQAYDTLNEAGLGFFKIDSTEELE